VHTIAVVDIHLVLLHCVAPIHAVGDVSVKPKFVPESVSVEPPVVGPFATQTSVTAGAATRPSICLPRPLDRI
jgi:hypothetical protein